MRGLFSTAALVVLPLAQAQIKGFNYGSTFTDGSAKVQSDFEADFTTAQGLAGGEGFTSARLYTMIQAGSNGGPISAIPAAIKTKTSLLLGLWASGGDAGFQQEIAALTSAIGTYGDAFTSLVDGISVGSEDLYRNSPMGIKSGSYVGANPETITNYISQLKQALSSTKLSGAKIGHVDTWTAWVNGSNSAVVEACDFIGVDLYPYFQDTMVNDISKGGSLFDDAISQTQNAIGGKPLWVTETGWPVSGKTVGQGLPSVENAKNYWDVVGCGKLFGKVNTWWFTLQDSAPTTPNPSFGIVGSTLSTTPLYDLSCDNVTVSSSSSSAQSSATSMATASTVASGSASAQTTSSIGDTGGSPGISGGIGLSSQATYAGTLTSDTAAATATATATASSSSSGSGSGSAGGASGSGSTAGSGSGSGSATGATGSGSGSGNSTTTSTQPTFTASASGLSSGALSAAFVAIMAAILAF